MKCAPTTFCLTLGLGLAAGQALACMPGGQTPGAAVKGPACSVTQVANEALTVGLGEARDFTAGVVVQRTFESNGCGSEETLVVMLCGQDLAVVLGTVSFHVMLTPEELKNQDAINDLERWVRQATRRKMVLSPEVLLDQGRKRDLDLGLTLPADGAIKMGGKRFSLACGCETFYPGP